MEDRTPALSLGFDAPLPAGTLGVLGDVEEVPGDEHGPLLLWEAWDGGGWQRLSVDDETAGLAVSGVVSVLWAGGPPPPSPSLLHAAGNRKRAPRPPARKPVRGRARGLPRPGGP